MHKENSKNIFIANDSLFFRTELSNVLIWAGHNVNYAEKGIAVLDAITNDPEWIDLLILDLQVPDFDGYGALEWLDDNGYTGKFPILVVTGAYETAEEIERLKGLGAAGFISKSLAAEQIIFHVNKLIFADKGANGLYRERLPVSIPVDFSLGNFSSTGTIINISENGAFLYTGVKHEEGTVLDLKFSLPGIDKVLNIKGTLKWVIDGMADQPFLCGYGMAFTAVSKDDQETLGKFIEIRSQSQV